jgi:hypothetical protein
MKVVYHTVKVIKPNAASVMLNNFYERALRACPPAQLCSEREPTHNVKAVLTLAIRGILFPALLCILRTCTVFAFAPSTPTQQSRLPAPKWWTYSALLVMGNKIWACCISVSSLL